MRTKMILDQKGNNLFIDVLITGLANEREGQ
jgi:hypothetical protein